MGKKVGGKIGTAITVAGAVIGLIDNALPVADGIVNRVSTKDETETDTYAIVPELYKDGFPLDISQAEQMLDEVGLKFMLVPLKTNQAKTEYKDYIVNQVIETNPKSGKKVKTGTVICVKYIPEEVIAESQKIFEDTIHEKEELKLQRQIKKEELTAKTKESVAKLADNAKDIFKHKDK
jgi:hypothetical protein